MSTTPVPERISPYRFPPHLKLYAEEDIIEAELIEDTELTQDFRDPGLIVDAELVEDPGELSPGAADIPEPAVIPGPEVEKPAGVRVAWKRPTDLFAEAGARVTARGMDLTAELSGRVRNKLGTVQRKVSEGTWHLAPMNPFGGDAPHRSMPEPGTISRG